MLSFRVRGDGRILLTDRTGRGVPWIDVGLLAELGLANVQLVKRDDRHVDLPPDLHERRRRPGQDERDGLDGANVGRDVLAGDAVTSRRCLNESAFLERERHGQTVDLQLACVAVGFGAQTAAKSVPPCLQLIEIDDIVQREHALSMPNRGKGSRDRSAHPLRR